jgi:hypothetical protein
VRDPKSQARYDDVVRWVPVTLALATTACSFLAVHGPGDPKPTEPIECTTSRAWPIADVVWAGVFVAAGVGALIEGRSQKRSGHNAEAAITMVPAGLLFVVSAMLGFDRVGDCRDALAGRP